MKPEIMFSVSMEGRMGVLYQGIYLMIFTKSENYLMFRFKTKLSIKNLFELLWKSPEKYPNSPEKSGKVRTKLLKVRKSTDNIQFSNISVFILFSNIIYNGI